MNRKLFIAIILFILTLAGKLVIDLHLYFSGGVNHHTIGAVIVLAILVGCSILSGWKSSFMWFFNFWALFDSGWGLFSGNGFFYIGQTSKLDLLQHQYPFLQVLKYLLVVISIIYYVVSVIKMAKKT
jgi:hypothetical protein